MAKFGRIVAVRKDGEESEFTNYKGEEVSGKYMPVATIFDNDGKLSVKFEENLDRKVLGADRDDFWFNVYKEDGERGGRGRGGKPAGRKGKPAPKRREEPETDDEDGSDDEDGEAPF